jgi:amino acid transporter
LACREYLVQLVGTKGAVAILVFTWLDGLLATAVCMLSAQRITYAIARDGILPFSKTFSKISKGHHLPINAALLIAFLSICINAAVIGSIVAFSAITAAATIGTNLSYLIPIVTRHTIGRKTFQSAKWNLGVMSLPIGIFGCSYICFLFVVLMLPQIYPVTAVSPRCPAQPTAGLKLTFLRRRHSITHLWSSAPLPSLHWVDGSSLSMVVGTGLRAQSARSRRPRFC